MDMDCIDMVRLWPVGCDADRFRNALGGHASCLGEAVCDYISFVAAVGLVDSARAAPWSPISSRGIETTSDVACPSRHLRQHRTGLLGLGSVVGGPIQSVCLPYGSGVVYEDLF